MAPASVDSIRDVADEGLDISFLAEQNLDTSSTEVYPLTVPGFEDLESMLNGSMLDVCQTSQDETVQAMGAMHNMNEWQTPESVGSLICWPGNGFNIGLNGDCTLAVEGMSSMSITTSQYQQRNSIELDSPRKAYSQYTTMRSDDSLFHCPFEGCNHKPEEVKKQLRFRIWVCRREDRELDPFYPLDGEAGDKKAYRDVKEYEQDFNWAFEYVKSMDPPDHEGIRALWNIQAPASHRAAGPFERHTSDQAISGHSGNPGLKVSECEFDNIHVLKVSADFTTCKAEDGSEFKVRRENWCKATLVKKDGGEYEGYIAKLSKNNFYTCGNPILITEERDKSKTKGKGKAH
ncbi:hypothetical protein NHJ6243_009435 [Beauveria neobassiana]